MIFFSSGAGTRTRPRLVEHGLLRALAHHHIHLEESGLMEMESCHALHLRHVFRARCLVQLDRTPWCVQGISAEGYVGTEAAIITPHSLGVISSEECRRAISNAAYLLVYPYALLCCIYASLLLLPLSLLIVIQLRHYIAVSPIHKSFVLCFLHLAVLNLAPAPHPFIRIQHDHNMTVIFLRTHPSHLISPVAVFNHPLPLRRLLTYIVHNLSDKESPS